MKRGKHMKITGMMINYYFVCKRKLWYFYNNINMEENNENVILGKLLDENSYRRDDKHINIDNVINIDFIREKNILHEVKKSKKIEKAGVWQTKYYLYYLKKRGVKDIRAEIDYPLIRKVTEVELTAGDETELDVICNDIETIVSKPVPPQFDKKNICVSCAYFDLCGV